MGDAVLHIRLSRIAADPPALDDCVAYIESEARQAVEFRPGSLGISVLADRTEGAALFGSVWASWEAMSASEETEAPLRAELAKRAGTPVTVKDYQIPISVIFDHAVLLRGGQAVRLMRIQSSRHRSTTLSRWSGTKSCRRCPRRPVSAPRCCSPSRPRGA